MRWLVNVFILSFGLPIVQSCDFKDYSARVHVADVRCEVMYGEYIQERNAYIISNSHSADSLILRVSFDLEPSWDSTVSCCEHGEHGHSDVLNKVELSGVRHIEGHQFKGVRILESNGSQRSVFPGRDKPYRVDSGGVFILPVVQNLSDIPREYNRAASDIVYHRFSDLYFVIPSKFHDDIQTDNLQLVITTSRGKLVKHITLKD